MNTPELSRLVKLKAIQHEPIAVEASEAERTALAARFGITGIASLRALITLVSDGARVSARGALNAAITQACAVSGEDFHVAIAEEFEVIFVPEDRIQPSEEAEEIELEREQLDEVEYRGDSFDLGEAIAQSLALAIDPYAEGPGADAARKKVGLKGDDAPSGPLAEALAALKKGAALK